MESRIPITYPSVVEFSFHGEAVQNDALSLKSIAVVDPVQQSRVGELRVLEATGGMIKIMVDTVDAIPDPVFYRVRMKQLNSSQPSTIVYAGTDVVLHGWISCVLARSTLTRCAAWCA